MPCRAAKVRANANRHVSQEQLERWKQMIHELPQVRLAKVAAARDAVRQGRYQGERIVDETVRRLAHDLGILQPDDAAPR